MSINVETANQLLGSGIHVDEFDQVVRMIDSDAADAIEWSGDPVADFKTAVLLVNSWGILPEDLSEWCERYGVEWIKPELLPPDYSIEL